MGTGIIARRKQEVLILKKMPTNPRFFPKMPYPGARSPYFIEEDFKDTGIGLTCPFGLAWVGLELGPRARRVRLELGSVSVCLWVLGVVFSKPATRTLL